VTGVEWLVSYLATTSAEAEVVAVFVVMGEDAGGRRAIRRRVTPTLAIV